ncbi:MAG: VOC family protein [Chloroflexi bacterium]|nr:VOC family protein [Chloroflexota bacterium]
MGLAVGISEIVLACHDQARTLAFYKDLLGFPLISPPDVPGPRFLRVADGAGGIPQMIVLVPLPAGSPPFSVSRPLHHLALTLESADFDKQARVLRTAGLEIRTGAHPVIPSRTMYVTDPEGNEVEFICRRAET